MEEKRIRGMNDLDILEVKLKLFGQKILSNGVDYEGAEDSDDIKRLFDRTKHLIVKDGSEIYVYRMIDGAVVKRGPFVEASLAGHYGTYLPYNLKISRDWIIGIRSEPDTLFPYSVFGDKYLMNTRFDFEIDIGTRSVEMVKDGLILDEDQQMCFILEDKDRYKIVIPNPYIPAITHVNNHFSFPMSVVLDGVKYMFIWYNERQILNVLTTKGFTVVDEILLGRNTVVTDKYVFDYKKRKKKYIAYDLKRNKVVRLTKKQIFRLTKKHGLKPIIY